MRRAKVDFGLSVAVGCSLFGPPRPGRHIGSGRGSVSPGKPCGGADRVDTDNALYLRAFPPSHATVEATGKGVSEAAVETKTALQLLDALDAARLDSLAENDKSTWTVTNVPRESGNGLLSAARICVDFDMSAFIRGDTGDHGTPT